MSRESQEQSYEAWAHDMFDHEVGNPDNYRYYPGEEAAEKLAAKRTASKAKPVIEYPVEPTHWDGKLYPEWELIKMGEADNTPGDANDAGWDKQHEGED